MDELRPQRAWPFICSVGFGEPCVSVELRSRLLLFNLNTHKIAKTMNLLTKIGRTLLFFLSAGLYTWLTFLGTARLIVWASNLSFVDIWLIGLGSIIGGILICAAILSLITKAIIRISPFHQMAKWLITFLIWAWSLPMVIGLWMKIDITDKPQLMFSIVFSIFSIVIISITTYSAHSKGN